MTNFNQEIEKIIQEEVDKRCHEEKLKVEFWRETAKERDEEKTALKKELAEIFEEYTTFKKEKEHDKNLLYLVKKLELDYILDSLNKSTRDTRLKAEGVPIWFKILFESTEDNKELVKVMIELGVDIPEEVLEFKNPINYSKEELIDLFSTKINFYVTNGCTKEDNAKFFFEALRVDGWSFNPNQRNLPLQLLLRNPLILDEDVFKLAIYALGNYAYLISEYQNLNIEQAIVLSKEFSSPHNINILLKCGESHDNHYIQEELMKLDLISKNDYKTRKHFGLLTAKNKVKYLSVKKDTLTLRELLFICTYLDLSEDLIREIFNNYLQ